MNVYAIADLHLDSAGTKPMDVFGPHWTGHFDKISQDWRERVQPDDLVLIPGDISWAMQLSQARDDLARIGVLPGLKVLLRGNHDYWWSGIGKLRDLLPPGMLAVQNDAIRLGDITVCGSRGWLLPGTQTNAEDQKIFDREIGRLELSLQAADRLGGRKIAMMHFPPVPEDGTPTPFSRLMSQYGVTDAVYGHLHGPAGRNAFSGTLDGVRYACVACDQIHFSLFHLLSDVSILPPGESKN